MNHSAVQKLTLSALFVALGLVLPTAFHAIGAGTVFLPMHIPVLLCGFVCGWQYGLGVGLIVPLLSSLTTGMPPFPMVALPMMFELATYGALTGIFHKKANVYVSLLGAMLAGRAVSGIASALLLGFIGKPYGLTVFLTGAFVTALPGIVLQLIVIPLLVLALERTGLLADPRKV